MPRASSLVAITIAMTTHTVATPLPFPYDWSRFPAAWFGGNDTVWESAEQLDAIGRYSLAILGWQSMITATNWTATLYAQINQAALLKARHPELPIFLYAGFGFAPGFDTHIWEVIRTASDGCPHHQPCRPVAEPFTDWVLETETVPVYSMSACEQMGLGYTNPPTDRCWNPMWSEHRRPDREGRRPRRAAPRRAAPCHAAPRRAASYRAASFRAMARHATLMRPCARLSPRS